MGAWRCWFQKWEERRVEEQRLRHYCRHDFGCSFIEISVIQVEMLTRQLEKESGAREEEVMCEDKRGRKQSVLEPAHSSL